MPVSLPASSFALKPTMPHNQIFKMEKSNKFTTYLNYALKGCLLLLALSAPISIAATQTAWAFCLLCIIIRAFFVKPTLRKDGIDIAILTFVGLTLLSSILSYEPQVSLRKMVAVSLVTIVYLFSENIKNRKMLHQVVAILLISSALVAIYAVGNFVVGRNLKVLSLTENSPLKVAQVKENDTIQKANGVSVASPDELAKIIAENEITKLKVYRYEVILDIEVAKNALLTGNDGTEKLGIIEWSRGRDVRAAGFYGHYTTFAEALQLIASLALGLFIASYSGRYKWLLLLALLAFCGALFLTVTRASWLSFIISSGVIILFGTSRKTILICAILAIPLIFGGLFYLQQKRNVGFIDTKDGSTTWRLTVWREGLDLLTSSPRHLAVGIGMDSLKTHWQEWHLFDNGNIPMGHMHCTPLQFALERGVPTLLAWLIWIFIYLKLLWQTLRRRKLDWIERGILLGSLGGTIGFLTSGLVHYNWGDSEVVMIFYLIMGLSLAVLRGLKETREENQTLTA